MSQDLPGPADLVAHLDSAGKLGPDRVRIRQALLAVPRHLFAPDTWWQRQPDGTYQPRLRTVEGDGRWYEELYGSVTSVMVTQVDGGRAPEQGAVGVQSTSSLSAPSAVVDMLALAAIQPGDRVLELGAGQGYSAALAAHLAGPLGHVFTVEYDARLAEVARANLVAAGMGNVEVITGDGRDGYPSGAPYQVVIATATFAPVPAAWLEQAADGARIVATQQSCFYPFGLLAATVAADGGSAAGSFIDDANFMWERGTERLVGNPMHLFVHEDQAQESVTTLSPVAVLGSDPAMFAIGRLIPDLYWWKGRYDEPGRADDFTLWLYNGHGSWAAADYTPGAGTFPVDQYGPRRLWTEMEAAYRWWQDAGQPAIERLGLLITASDQQVTVDGQVQQVVRAVPRAARAGRAPV